MLFEPGFPKASSNESFWSEEEGPEWPNIALKLEPAWPSRLKRLALCHEGPLGSEISGKGKQRCVHSTCVPPRVSRIGEDRS